MKKIITLNNQDFEFACRQLAELSYHFSYDLTIAIASGGVYVAKNFSCNDFVTICCNRNNKKNKRKKFIQKIIKAQPRWINNILRNLEYKIQLSKWDNMNRNVNINEYTLAKLKALRENSTILIIDDAIDSGNSLIQVIEEVKKINQTVNIKSAAIVVTDKNKARYLPDFYIYENVLIRFPWALDV